MTGQLKYALVRVLDGWVDFASGGLWLFVVLIPFLLVVTPIVFVKALFFEERAPDVGASRVRGES